MRDFMPLLIRLGLLLALVAAVTSAQGVVISEFMAGNSTSLEDEDGDSSDWIELHNPSSTPVDLSGWFLTDDPGTLTEWSFPNGVVLAAGAYLVVFASDKDRAVTGQPLHTNFKLSLGGEYLALTQANGTTVEHAYAPQYPQQYTDVAFGLPSQGPAGYLFPPTPDAANGAGFVGVAEEVSASPERAYFTTPLQVVLSTPTPGADIYYSTDGSVPDPATGTLYTGAIAVTNTTPLRAAAYKSGYVPSPVVSHTYVHPQSVPVQPASPAGWPSNWGTHVIGAGPATFVAPAKYDLDPLSFTSSELVEALHALPAVSIILDPDDLMGSQNGIYVNPDQDWVREASVELISNDGSEPGFQKAVLLELHGAGSRLPELNGQHSLRMNPKGIIDYPILGERGPAATRSDIILRGGMNDNRNSNSGNTVNAIFVRDEFARRTHESMGQLSTTGRWVHLYLNGLYWGLYNLVRRPDAKFMAEELGGSKIDYAVFKHKFADPIASSPLNEWNTAHGVTTFAAFDAEWDVDAFIDYFLVNFYFGTGDWMPNNWYAGTRMGPTGRFLPMIWDAELALKPQVDRTTKNVADTPSFVYHAMKTASSEFRLRFGDRFRRHCLDEGALSPARCVALLQDEAARIRAALPAQTARWENYAYPSINAVHGPFQSMADWETQLLVYAATYFEPRLAEVAVHFEAAGLVSPVAAPVLGLPAGSYEPGQQLTITQGAGLAIYFRSDGGDPRQPGGAIDPAATLYSGAIPLSGVVTVKARARSAAGTWSNLSEASYLPTGTGPVINEIMALNQRGVRDEANEREPWIELLNSGPVAVAVGGHFLTDDMELPTRWQLPPGVVLSPGATFLVWADGDPGQGLFHAAFTLDPAGGEIALFAPDGVTLVDRLAYGPQIADVATGRLDDGGRRWASLLRPTPGSSNASGFVQDYLSLDPRVNPLRLDVHFVSDNMVGVAVAEAPPGSTVFLLGSAAPFPLGYGFSTTLPTTSVILVDLPSLIPLGVGTADGTGFATLGTSPTSHPSSQDMYLQAFSWSASGQVLASQALRLDL